MPSSIATSSPGSAASRIATTCWAAPARPRNSTTSRRRSASGNDAAIEVRGRLVEAAEDHLVDPGLRLDRAHRDLGRGLLGVAVDAGRNGRKGDALQAVLLGDSQAAAVTALEQRGLAGSAAVPHRADGMDHVPRDQVVALGDLGIAGVAAMERAAFGQQLRTRRAMD